MAVSYQFLPWTRRGLAVALDVEDNLGAGNLMDARGQASVGVTLAAPHDGEAIAPLALRLHGPGDVIGIDTRLVIRTDPKPEATNFEPNYLAIIDFDPPDFPWMLTPAKAQGDQRLRPWLVLVVLEAAKVGPPRMAPGALLPSVRIAAADVADELPDLGESWSWAHTQLVNDDAAQIQADLQAQPASNISRLVCPRRLKERCDYIACVVPAFKPGVLRGLGLVTDEAAPEMTQLGPAWDLAAGVDVVLPVYHHWAFSTAPKGDFESLARRLRTPGSYEGTPMEGQLAAIGTIPMSVDDLLNGVTPGLQTTMEGALVPISFTPGALPPATQAESLEIIVNTPQDQVVNPVGDGPNNAAGRRLEVKPPMVGGWHAKRHQAYRAGQGPVGSARLGAHWLAELNLNPRYRGAAGYGAEVVRKFQEDYVDACWDQVGDILAAEMKFNLTRLAVEALTSLKRRHFDALPPERLLQVFGPVLPRVEAFGTPAQTFRINGQVASLGGRLARSSLPAALTDSALRRVASPAHRALRLAARLNKATDALPGLATRYVGAMALATKRDAAFKVNEFMPDGIVGTHLFDGVTLEGDANRVVDLSAIGLPGKTFTVGQVRQTLDRGNVATRTLATKGVPALTIRVGQHLGVFTDLHVGRFGEFVTQAPAVKASDWGLIASQVEAMGQRGIEGFLLESTTATKQLQVSAMRLDARSGSFTIDHVKGRFDQNRRSMSLTTKAMAKAIQGLQGLPLAKLPITTSRAHVPGGLISALPPNAMLSRGGELGQFTLDDNLEFGRAREGGDVISITLPPAIRQREVLNRFSAATRGVQASWRDAFAARRVEVQVVDFPVAQAAEVLRARTDPALTLPLRLASTVSVAEAALKANTPHVAAYLSNNALADLRFMVPALFDRVMAWPRLRRPLYADLVAYDKNAFMPGVDDLPQDLIMLVQVNQCFIDAFMAGANHEMNRELLWRAFPTDLRGTPFQRFWRPRADDMEPMHLWNAQRLGQRTDPNMLAPNRVALLIRGQLLRRYPNTAVYAWKKRTTPTNPNADPPDITRLMKGADGLPPAGAIQRPVFQGVIPPDITFFGFDIDKDDARDNWCFVLEEQMTEPRFGFDVEVPVPGQPQGSKPLQRGALKSALLTMATPGNALLAGGYNAYKALSWSHLQVQAGRNFSISSLINPADPPFVDFPALNANATAADIAKALLQQPFRAYYLGEHLST